MYDEEPFAPHNFKFGEELDAELSVKGIFCNWEYDGAGLDPEKTIFLNLSTKPDFNLDGFWSPLNSKECNEKVKEWFEKRSCHSYSGSINSSLAFCDGPVRITCDQELFGVPPGENLSAFFYDSVAKPRRSSECPGIRPGFDRYPETGKQRIRACR